MTTDYTTQLELYLGDHYRGMVKKATSVLREETDAEDIVHDVVVKLLEAPHLFLEVERLGGFLATVIYRRCVDQLRKIAVRGDSNIELTEEISSLKSDAAENMEETEYYTAILEIVDDLTPELRHAFIENVVNGKTFNEISTESGIPLGTLLARKRKAVAKIKSELKIRGLIDEF